MQSSQAEGAKMLTGSSSHAAGTGMPHSGGGITTLVVCNSFTDCGEHITIMDRLRQNDRTLGSNLDYRHILTKTIEKKRFTGLTKVVVYVKCVPCVPNHHHTGAPLPLRMVHVDGCSHGHADPHNSRVTREQGDEGWQSQKYKGWGAGG